MDPIVLLSSLKAIIDLAVVVKNTTNDIELKVKTSELYNLIIALQNGIMTIQAENHSLLQENQSLGKKLMEIETWEKEKSKYSLQEICPQVFVYASNKTDTPTEPTHWLCVKCYNDGKKSILQLNQQVASGNFYICHNCSSEICDHSKSIIY